MSKHLFIITVYILLIKTSKALFKIVKFLFKILKFLANYQKQALSTDRYKLTANQRFRHKVRVWVK